MDSSNHTTVCSKDSDNHITVPYFLPDVTGFHIMVPYYLPDVTAPLTEAKNFRRPPFHEFST